MIRVAIVDYSIGNLFSVVQACRLVGLEPHLTSEPAELKSADGVIVPGVGAFGAGMEELRRTGMDFALKEFIISGKPLFGVCLGMQLLCESSEEFGHCDGLGIIEGNVRSFRGSITESVPVPQIMWNTLLPAEREWRATPLEGITSETAFYFVHSYYCDIHSAAVLSYTEYGGVRYCSSLLRDNVFATQFHPEKSALAGVGVYRKWKQLAWKGAA